MPESTDQPTPELTWRVHPARDQPGRALAAGLVIAGIATLAAVLYQSLFWFILVAALMVLILQRFFLPSRFEVFEDAIVAHYAIRTLRLPWSRLRRFAVDERGGFLSTRSRQTWVDGLSGMHLLFDDRREQIVRTIRDHLDRARTMREETPTVEEPAS